MLRFVVVGAQNERDVDPGCEWPVNEPVFEAGCVLLWCDIENGGIYGISQRNKQVIVSDYQ